MWSPIFVWLVFVGLTQMMHKWPRTIIVYGEKAFSARVNETQHTWPTGLMAHGTQQRWWQNSLLDQYKLTTISGWLQSCCNRRTYVYSVQSGAAVEVFRLTDWSDFSYQKYVEISFVLLWNQSAVAGNAIDLKGSWFECRVEVSDRKNWNSSAVLPKYC